MLPLEAHQTTGLFGSRAIGRSVSKHPWCNNTTKGEGHQTKFITTLQPALLDWEMLVPASMLRRSVHGGWLQGCYM
jgi:hypothetical protein